MRLKNWTPVIALLAISFILMGRQVLTEGYFSVLTGDAQAFASWAWQFNQALISGIIYPRWMPLDFWSYGSPVFIQYPPLAYYLTSFFQATGVPLITAMNLVKLLSFFVFGFGTYLILYRLYGRRYALISVLIIMSLPFNVLIHYYYFTFSSIVCMMFLPFVILFLYNYYISHKMSELIKAGVFFGAMLTSHLITTYLFCLILATFGIFNAWISKNIRRFTAVILIVLVGALISSAYLVPLLLERKYIQSSNFINSPTGFEYKNFLIPASNNFNIHWNLYLDFISDNCIFFLFISLIFLFTYLKTKNSIPIVGYKHFEINLLIVNILSLFMFTRPSYFLWEITPFLKYAQFPFRWMLVSYFLTSIIIGITIYRLGSLCKSKFIFPSICFGIILLFLSLDYKMISNSHIFSRDELLPPKSVNWTLEHLPQNVKIESIEKTHAEMNLITITEGKGKIIKKNDSLFAPEFLIMGETPLILRIGTFAFPGWEISAGSHMVPIVVEKNTGLILAKLPQGQHELILSFNDTPARTAGKFMSIASGLVCIIFIARSRDKKDNCSEPHLIASVN